MKETKNGEPCCETSNAAPSCSCASDGCDCEKPVERKPLKIAICLLVLLAIVVIITYRTISTSDNSNNASNDAGAFVFRQLTSEAPSSEDGLYQAEQDFSE